MINFEIKNKISNLGEIKKILKNSRAIYCGKFFQNDIYFKTGEEKIKIREINNKELQLITYFRKEKKGKKESSYKIKHISNIYKKKLTKRKIPVCEIIKERDLWILDHTRIHLDKVKKLGKFVELETVIDHISNDEANIEFGKIIKLLKLNKKKSIPYSYSDLVSN
jgi:adenylate cyclase, class 2